MKKSLYLLLIAICTAVVSHTPASAQAVLLYTQPTATNYAVGPVYGAPKLSFTWAGPGKPSFPGLNPVYVGSSGTVQLTTSPATITVVVPSGIATLRITGPAGSNVAPPVVQFNAAAGSGWALAKNYDFGTSASSTVKTSADLVSNFEFHDQFNTISNGVNYGCMIVAEPTAPDFNVAQHAVPGQTGKQPKAAGFRVFTADSLLLNVRQLDLAHDADKTTIGPAWNHDCGSGSMMAKFTLPNGGKLLGKDMVVEARFRMVAPVPLGYWFAPIWTASTYWTPGVGPEMDPLESFSSDGGNVEGRSWHSNSVGGSDAINYSNWWPGMATTGLTNEQRYLTLWHTLTYVYRADDTFEVFFDGRSAQHGTQKWTNPGAPDPLHMPVHFLFDATFGHIQVRPIQTAQPSIPAGGNVFQYEYDYIRIGTR